MWYNTVMTTKKTIFIMRGLPGSGKSTWARTHAASAVLNGISVAICSTDDFHMVNGEYRFNREKLGYFHTLNQELVKEHMKLETDLIFVDNTNIRRKDFKQYIYLAGEYGYEVQEIIIGSMEDEDFITTCVDRNTHKVPREIIERMAQRFEK